MDKIKRIALIPAYEPEAIMNDVVKDLRENNFDVLIVNDGSDSKYTGVFEAAEAYATVLDYPVNLGKGAAVKTGLKYIAEHYTPPYIVVTVDADGQHKVKDAVAVCSEAAQYLDALVLGSRKFTGRIPLRSKFGNTVTRFVYRLSSGVKVRDTQTGLRAFSDSSVPALLSVSGERYEYEMNVLMRFAKENIPIREVYIETVYINDNSSSHFKAFRDSYRIYKEILKFSASSFIGFCVDYAVYCLMFMLTKQIILSNVSARIVSASVNYTINRKLVFNSKICAAKSAVQYFILAAAILACGTGILKLLTSHGINGYFSKILTELVMFFVSWFIQHKFIFRKPKIEKHTNNSFSDEMKQGDGKYEKS